MSTPSVSRSPRHILGAYKDSAHAVFPGVLASGVVANCAAFLSEHYSAPVMLYALLIGLAMNFLSQEGKCKQGIELSAKKLLRVGVALLGLRITFNQLGTVGWEPLLFVMFSVLFTIACSMVVAKWMGFQSLFGLLSGGATAICGASAAMALSAALPNHPLKERATLFTVIGVSVLSTVCMIVYPILTHYFDLPPAMAGFFIGATIHDVAQVVGAGYSISPEAGDIATLVKMTRVAMLLPVILLATWIARSRMSNAGSDADKGGERPPLLPGFVVAFAILMTLNSIGVLPAQVVTAGNDLSRWLLITSMAAIGMKTQVKQIIEVGIKPVLLMLGETVFLAGLILLFISLR